MILSSDSSLWFSRKYRFGRMENGTRLSRTGPTLLPLARLVSISQRSLPVSSPNVFSQSSWWSHYGINSKIVAAALSLILNPCLSILFEIFYTKTIIKLSAWNEIQPLSDMKVVMIVWVCLRVSVCVLTAFYFISLPWIDIWKREWRLPKIVCLDFQRDQQTESCKNHCYLAGFCI